MQSCLKMINFKVVFILFLFTQSSCNEELIFQIDFENDFENKNVEWMLKHESIELSEGEGINGSNAIKVKYEGYERGSKSVMRLFKLPYNLEEATLNYAVKFDEKFKFVKGGKLHGLVPENKIVGGRNMTLNGWSARANFKEDGKVASYIYYQNKPGKWGDGETSSSKIFTPGKYNDVAIYVKLNTPATSRNGVFEIWVDGNLIISHHSIKYRGTEEANTLISNFYFSTFHGGHSLKYAPTNNKGEFSNEYAWFDNFEVYKGKYIRFNKSKNKQ